MQNFKRALPLILFTMLLFLTPRHSYSKSGQENPPFDFSELSFEELSNIEVTSVTRKPQKMANAAASVFVITSEDLFRLGIMSIPEALRMVPGLQVSRISTSAYAVSSRGFPSRFANKLLVQIDGRTIYSSVYSGVFWEIQDILIENIKRIEVVKGPGASMWGANAVNGIINIITKHSEETVGEFAYAGAGYEDIEFYGIRHGGKVTEKGAYRIYTKFLQHDETVGPKGDDTYDGHKVIQGGGRADVNLSESTSVQIQGDLFSAEANEIMFFPSRQPPDYQEKFKLNNSDYGGNVLLKGIHKISSTSDVSLQIYYDKVRIEYVRASCLNEIMDADFQHRFRIGKIQEFMWGIAYRLIRDDFKVQDPDFMIFTPFRQSYDLFSFFFHDEITLFSDSTTLIFGSKFENNYFTGFEIQPNIRMIWTDQKKHSVWTSVSKAVRTPSRSENDVEYNIANIPPFVPDSEPIRVMVSAENDLLAEELIALEAGYRGSWSSISLDMAFFLNFYNNLGGFSLSVDNDDAYTQKVLIENLAEGKTYGGEIMTGFQVTDWYQIHFAYAFIKMEIDKDKPSISQFSANNNDVTPDHQFSIRSYIDLPWHLKLNLFVWYMDDILANQVGSYWELNAALIWSPNKNITFTLSGNNLLDSRHVEFKEEALTSEENAIERSVYLKASLYF